MAYFQLDCIQLHSRTSHLSPSGTLVDLSKLCDSVNARGEEDHPVIFECSSQGAWYRCVECLRYKVSREICALARIEIVTRLDAISRTNRSKSGRYPNEQMRCIMERIEWMIAESPCIDWMRREKLDDRHRRFQMDKIVYKHPAIKWSDNYIKLFKHIWCDGVYDAAALVVLLYFEGVSLVISLALY